MLEKIASLPESTRSAEIEKLSKEELVKLADEIIANASNIKYFATAPDTRAFGNKQVRDSEIVLKRYIKAICYKIVERNQILAIDNPNLEHGSLHRIKAIIKDIENRDLSPLRFHELLAENYVDHDLDRVKTFLCIAAEEMNADRFISFIGEFKTALGDQSFNNYLQTPNILSTDEQLNIYQIYVEDRASFKVDIRIKNKIKKFYLSKGFDYSENTHTESVHRTVDQSVCALYFSMASDEEISQDYYPSNKERPTKISALNLSEDSHQKAKAKIDESIASLKKLIDSVTKCNDKELFEKYYRYTSGNELKKQSFESLDDSGKKALADFREKAEAASRLVNSYLDIKQICGLTVREALGCAFYACTDTRYMEFVHKDDQANNFLAQKLNFFAAMYTARRGYNIDYNDDGADRPKCPAGQVNEIIKGVESISKLVEVNLVTAKQAREAIKNIYLKIIREKEELVKGLLNTEAAEHWRATNEITGDLRKRLSEIFNNDYRQEFAKEYSDLGEATVSSIIAEGLNNIPMPEELRTQKSLKLTKEQVIAKMQNSTMPDIFLVKNGEGNYEYISGLELYIKEFGENLIYKVLGVEDSTTEISYTANYGYIARSNHECCKRIGVKKAGKFIPISAFGSMTNEELDDVLAKDAGHDWVADIQHSRYSERKMLFILEHLAPNPLKAEQVCVMLNYICFIQYENAFNLLFNKYIDDISVELLNACNILHISIRFNNDKAFKLLIEKGVDVKNKDFVNNTPLHWAIKVGKTEIVKLLINKGADVNTKNCLGETPLYLAAKRNNNEIADLLIKHGGNISCLLGLGKRRCNKIMYEANTFSYMNMFGSIFMQYLGLHNKSNIESSLKQNKLSLTYPGCYLPPCVSAGAIITGTAFLIHTLVKCALSRG